MSYNDPCHTDPAHEKAVVGINPPPGQSGTRWVCMDCFEAWLGGNVQLARVLAAYLNAEAPDAH